MSKINQKAELLHRAVQLYNDGYKLVSISRELNLHVSTVRRWLRSAGIVPKSSRYDKNKKVDESGALQKALGKKLEKDLPDQNEAEMKLAESIDTHDARIKETKDIDELAEAQASPADQYQAYMAASAIRLMRDNIKNLRGPRTIKDMDILDNIIRRSLNIDKKNGTSGSMHIDISILNGSKTNKINTKKVIDVETLDNNEQSETT